MSGNLIIKAIRNIIILLPVLLFSCDKPGLFVSCKDCSEQEPVNATITVTIDPFSKTNYYPEVDVYEGNIEDGLLINTYNSDGGTISISKDFLTIINVEIKTIPNETIKTVKNK